jgi:hypothetical protein
MLVVHFSVVLLVLTAGFVCAISLVMQGPNRGSVPYIAMTMFADALLATEQIIQNLIFAKICYQIRAESRSNMNASHDHYSSINS